MEASNAVERDGQFFAPDGRQLFAFECPACHHEGLAAKSFAMDMMGYNAGSAECGQCGHYLHLQMEPDVNGDTMKATLFEDIIAGEAASEAAPGQVESGGGGA